MVVPPFFPDQAKPYISETESKALFERFNEISRKTGAPIMPMALFPPLSVIPFPFIPLVPKSNQMFLLYSLIVLMTIFFILSVGILTLLYFKRRNGLKNLIEEWNRTEGIPKGIYFALGTENGVSSVDFFTFLSNNRYGNRGYVVIQNVK